MVNWSQACAAQASRPLWQLQQANYGGSLFAVSHFLCSKCAAAKCVCPPSGVHTTQSQGTGGLCGLTRESGRFVRAVSRVQRLVVFALGDGRCEEADVVADGLVQRAGVCGQRGGSSVVVRVHAEQYFLQRKPSPRHRRSAILRAFRINQRVVFRLFLHVPRRVPVLYHSQAHAAAPPRAACRRTRRSRARAEAKGPAGAFL